jgi:DNA-binding LytR/AlgR family response regulator
MPTALVADDEEAPRAHLVAALRHAWPDLQVVAECINGIDAWDAWLEHEPAVCFLDVRMPGLTGIEVAQRIGPQARVVFVTARGDHALAAFEAGGVDHVLKPIDTTRLAQTVARVQAHLDATSPAVDDDLQRLLTRLVGQVRKPAPLDAVQVGAGKQTLWVPVDEVLVFEADNRYTRVVRAAPHGDVELLSRTPLKELAAQLDPAVFWQIHRAVIVQQRHVDRVERGADGRMQLSLHGLSEKLPVARHFQSLFRDR